jgi:hypothetical protein
VKNPPDTNPLLPVARKAEKLLVAVDRLLTKTPGRVPSDALVEFFQT